MVYSPTVFAKLNNPPSQISPQSLLTPTKWVRNTKCGTLKINNIITGLSEDLSWDTGIEEPFWGLGLETIRMEPS